MEKVNENSDVQASNDADSEMMIEVQSDDTVNKSRKRKKYLHVEKLGESKEYDESLLKRRKKKLQGKGITVALPKKSLTAYAIFVKQKRRELQDWPDFNVRSPDMMKKLGKIWSALTKDERKIYEDVARKDKERYDKEMKKLTANGRTIEKLHEVENKRPKKWLSAYMIFVRDVRSKVWNANPDMPVLQIMKEVGFKWQNLTAPEKKVYQDLADIDKIRYKNELKDFEKEVETLQVIKPSKTKSNNKVKKANENKDNIVKSTPKSVPLFDEFTQNCQELLSKQQPNLSAKEVEEIIKEKWESFTEPEKIKYTQNPKLWIEPPKPVEIEAKIENVIKSIPPPPAPIVKDDALIKRPLNIIRPDSTVPNFAKIAAPKASREPPKYKMQTDSYFYNKGNEADPSNAGMNYKMVANTHGTIEYSKLFPEGQSPPILEHRKRNRRISSIVGVPQSQHYGTDYEFEEILDPRGNDIRKPNSRSTSIDLNNANDPNYDGSYQPEQRKSGVYYFAGIAQQSPIEMHFTQHPIFKSNNDARRNYRKQSSNLPISDPSDFKPFNFN